MVKYGKSLKEIYMFITNLFKFFQENKMAAYAGKHGENVVANIIAEAQGSKASLVVLWYILYGILCTVHAVYCMYSTQD